MKHDDAEYYFLNFETDALENEAGATHIGMFMAWMILHELAASGAYEERDRALRAVRERRMTGPAFVIDFMDCKLFDADLTAIGNAFTEAYYNAHYYADYMQAFGVDDTPDSFCSVQDSWANFAKIARLIDLRFDTWKKARQPIR